MTAKKIRPSQAKKGAKINRYGVLQINRNSS
jgi:hypothetical protein